MAEPLETSDSVFVHLLLNCIENHSTNKWIYTKFVDSKQVAKTRKHRSNLARWNFLLFSCSGIVKKIFPGQIQQLFSYTANQSTWGDHYLYYVFSIADVNARKNFACINFGVSVDSYRQVKLWLLCIVIFYGFFFSLLCINKPARGVAQNNSKAKYGQTHF